MRRVPPEMDEGIEAMCYRRLRWGTSATMNIPSFEGGRVGQHEYALVLGGFDLFVYAFVRRGHVDLKIILFELFCFFARISSP